MQASLAAISKLVLEPLIAAIGKQEELLNQSRPSLWLLPWSALRSVKSTVENWNIHYLVSAANW